MPVKSKWTLEVKNLSFKANGRQILENISFKVSDGDRLAIMGSSGSGKSTLLRALNRLIEPSSGDILVEGKNYRKIPPRELRRKVGLLLQTPHLFPGTVADNLRFGPEQKGEIFTDEKIEELLSQVNLQGYGERRVDKLSGGEMQRVSLARTLANSPCVLLLDEPTSALDKKSQMAVEKLIDKITREQKLTFILVTHSLSQAKRLADKVIVIDKGKMKEAKNA